MPERSEVTVAPASPSAPEAVTLIAALDADLVARYPEPDANHLELTEAEAAAGAGVFLLARAGGTAVGCGALRARDRATGEVKRMYVVPRARGSGVGHRLLGALEEHARGFGLRRLVLETGVRQPEALALYQRAGFHRIACFDEYAGSPLSVCLAKDLSASLP